MALPLNIFKTVTHVLGSTSVGIYTAPVGYSGVVLLSSRWQTQVLQQKLLLSLMKEQQQELLLRRKLQKIFQFLQTILLLSLMASYR